MGQGYGANFALIIAEEDILKVIPTEFQALDDLLETYQVTYAELACAVDKNESIDEAEEGAAEEIMAAWKTATKAFQAQTNLSLFIGYHDSSEKGSRYDGVDGVYFSLSFEEVYEHTPAAKNLLQKGIQPELTQWVTFG